MRIKKNTCLLSYTIIKNQLFQRQQKRKTMSIKKFYRTNLSKMYTNWKKHSQKTHSHKVDAKYSKKYQVTGLTLKLKSMVFKKNLFEMIRK